MESTGKQFSSFGTGLLQGKAIGWDHQFRVLAYIMGISIRVTRQLDLVLRTDISP